MKSKLAVIATVAALLGGNILVSAVAQTNGMDRRDNRRDTRQGSREDKRECKAGDEKSRPECRQDKRDEKQENRGSGDEKKEAQPAPPPAK